MARHPTDSSHSGASTSRSHHHADQPHTELREIIARLENNTRRNRLDRWSSQPANRDDPPAYVEFDGHTPAAPVEPQPAHTADPAPAPTPHNQDLEAQNEPRTRLPRYYGHREVRN